MYMMCTWLVVCVCDLECLHKGKNYKFIVRTLHIWYVFVYSQTKDLTVVFILIRIADVAQARFQHLLWQNIGGLEFISIFLIAYMFPNHLCK